MLNNDISFFNEKPAWAIFHEPFTKYKNKQFKIYTYNNIPIAYITYEVDHDFISVDFLEVHPDFRNRKIGTNILNTIITENIQNVNMIKLCSGYQSIKFYEKLGFKIVKPEKVGQRLMIKLL